MNRKIIFFITGLIIFLISSGIYWLFWSRKSDNFERMFDQFEHKNMVYQGEVILKGTVKNYEWEKSFRNLEYAYCHGGTGTVMFFPEGEKEKIYAIKFKQNYDINQYLNKIITVKGEKKEWDVYTNCGEGTEYCEEMKRIPLQQKCIDKISGCVEIFNAEIIAIEDINAEDISLSVEDFGEKIIFKAKPKIDIFIPKSGLFSPPYYSGPWKLYHFVEEEWKEIVIDQPCIDFWCHDPCDKPTIACFPIPHPPFCEKIFASENIEFQWPKSHIIRDEINCNGITKKCYKKVFADKGKYKIVFFYKKDSCPVDIKGAEGKGVFQDNIQSIEKIFVVQ